MTATIPPKRARAGLLADAAPVKVAGAAVLALLDGATVGRLEMVLKLGTWVVAGATDEAQVVGSITGELGAGAEATEEDAGEDHVAQVAEEETGTGTTGEEAAAEVQGPQVVEDVFAGITGTVVVCTFVVVKTMVLVLVLVAGDQDDQMPQEVLLDAGKLEAGSFLLLETTAGVHTAQVSDEDEDGVVLFCLTGDAGVVEVLGSGGEDVHAAQVSDEDGVVLGDSTGEAGVVDALAFTEEEAAGVLLVVAGEDGVEDGVQLLSATDGEEDSAGTTGEAEEVLDFPSQLPHAEDGVASEFGFPPPRDEAGVAAGVEAGVACQFAQLSEGPCLSCCSATPTMTELAKASRTKALLTMVAT